MSQNITPNFVYQRKRKCENSHPNCKIHPFSKSNLALHSPCMKIDAEDAGECSSSGVEKMSERDICISILRKQGIIDKVRTKRDRALNTGISCNNSKICKICEHMDKTSNLLLCDNCDEGFHISCCNPNVTRIPLGEWLCRSCLKLRGKIGKENSNSLSMNKMGGSGNSGSECELEFMLRDTEPYISSVRIGDKFQANVPDWSGQVNDESDLSGVEIDPFSNVNTEEQTKPLKLGTFGNWLQCQKVTGEDSDETICGKWRRAPLFEVQMDDWKCFDCVLWDPAYADCAVPQALDTEEVMKQLKYIDTLRPRLDAKMRRLSSSRSIH